MLIASESPSIAIPSAKSGKLLRIVDATLSVTCLPPNSFDARLDQNLAVEATSLGESWASHSLPGNNALACGTPLLRQLPPIALFRDVKFTGNQRLSA